MKFSVFLVISLAVLQGCAKLPVHNSMAYSQPDKQELTSPEINRYYESDHRMRYGIANSKDHLYIRIESIDETKQRQLLMQGIKIVFNTEGKKKEQFSLTYPYRQGPMQRPSRDENTMDRSNSRPLMQQSLPPTAAFRNGNKLTIINAFDKKNPIKCIANKDKKGNLVLQMSIPLDSLNIPVAQAGQELAIGILDAEKTSLGDPKAMGGRPQGGGMQGGGGPGGGGMQGGGGPGGGRPGGGQGQMGGGQSSMNSQSNLKIWFKAVLH